MNEMNEFFININNNRDFKYSEMLIVNSNFPIEKTSIEFDLDEIELFKKLLDLLDNDNNVKILKIKAHKFKVSFKFSDDVLIYIQFFKKDNKKIFEVQRRCGDHWRFFDFFNLLSNNLF